ncbi:MAG: hypothetical protein HY999_05770, partial [Nitrospinae bacterium]|nr:hypothetical protein [Nitrospinota bacterium]
HGASGTPVGFPPLDVTIPGAIPFDTYTLSSYIKGDVNGDNQIRINDVLIYLRYIVNLPIDYVNSIDDVTCDNELRINDVLLVLQKVVGYEVNFCCDLK